MPKNLISRLILATVPSFYPTQFKGKLINQTWEISKKTNLSPIFAHLPEIWSLKNFPWIFTSTSSLSLFQAIILWNLKKN